VIISTSGMMTGGPVMTWALEILPDPSAALFLCGYQDEESPGRRLQQLARESRNGQAATFRLDDQDHSVDVDVRARVSMYSLSAHADRGGLMSIVQSTTPGATMLVHGEERRQRRFAKALHDLSFETVPTERWQGQ
jgi:predicted metal-dependent RNase